MRILDVEDDNEELWALLGGKGDIKPSKEEESTVVYTDVDKKMFSVSDADGTVAVKEVHLSKDSLVSSDVFIIDTGDECFVWIGNGSTPDEKQQAIIIAFRYLQQMDRHDWTLVTRVLEGQEARCKPFLEVF